MGEEGLGTRLSLSEPHTRESSAEISDFARELYRSKCLRVHAWPNNSVLTSSHKFRNNVLFAKILSLSPMYITGA